ncbi:UDP-Glycosyltransferase/glycogen phosphorylase [Aspergillus cavernicola]|uniref:Alpha-1,3/1,6-mannosyltransferase ALG2 n=1 Tax=Aspergillus cavernicola TaxID=176166 RepID=A0ABR4HQV3_9EURO
MKNQPPPPANITIIHPDLGIGGAERLIIDVALALQNTGHKVTIYTSHRDKAHCFEEARDGTLDVRVRGDGVFPPHWKGRFHVLMAILRQVHLTWALLGDLDLKREEEGEGVDEVFIVDQVPACVPLLKIFGARPAQRKGAQTQRQRQRQRILFYCHFPDQLLARRDGGSALLQLVKGLYRYPFDWFEGWAMSAADRVVANSRFTRGVVRGVFGGEKVGDVRVVYPCVDTEPGSRGVGGKGELWGGKKILLSVNRFERKKDLALAIRAYHGLGGMGRRGVRLVIAGGYDPRVQENVQYHKELDTLATTLGLQTATSKTVLSALSIPDSIDVLFLPSVPTAFRDTLLSQSRLLLYTPINEHFGIVPIEAMRAGIPVLASNTGGPLETIVEGETGWLRDATDPAQWTEVMEKVLYHIDEKEIERMAGAASERVEREFSLRAMGEKLEAEIGGMLEDERRPFDGVKQVGGLLGVFGVLVAVLVAAVFRCFGLL